MGAILTLLASSLIMGLLTVLVDEFKTIPLQDGITHILLLAIFLRLCGISELLLRIKNWLMPNTK